jgi:superfamily II DNA or RNA helicase
MRKPRKRVRPLHSGLPADPLFLTTDLEAWAGERIAQGGRECALLGRVVSLRLSPEGKIVDARVRDSGPVPYRVEVAAHGELLVSRCTCPFDVGPACKHAVAAVEALRFPRPALSRGRTRRGTPRRSGRLPRGQGRIVAKAPVLSGTLLSEAGEWAFTREERIDQARQEELRARKERARREKARTRRLVPGDGPAQVLVSRRGAAGSYTVTFRGEESLASCTCPDYAKSELGTCKHADRARRALTRGKKRAPVRLLSVWWRPHEWATAVPDPLREIRMDASDASAAEPLARYFGPDGRLLAEPAGMRPSLWVRRAVASAKTVAAASGMTLDVDPAVPRLVKEAARQEVTAARLRAVAVGDARWQAVESGLGLALHPYQKEGAIFLATRGRAFLADDMGLGKTVQAVVAALLLRGTAGARRVLVVCPASLKHQWRAEIRKVCGEDSVVVEGARAARRRAYRSFKHGFLILNYELVLKDLDRIARMKPDLVVLDEAQRIKNWDTKTAKAVKSLASPFAFILTGTPLENRLTELHSLVEFLHPRALGPRWRLIPFYAVTEAAGRVLAYESLDVLRGRLRGFFLRRERKAVLDQLPPRTDNTFWTEMTQAQLAPYRRHARRIASLVAGGRTLRPAEVRMLLQSLTSMRILCNAHAQYAWDGHATRSLDRAATPAEMHALHSPKLEEFVDVLEDLLDGSDAKVVVFSQWERLLRLAHFAARGLLDRRGERADVFHGGLDSRSRSRMLDAFGAEPDLRVLFSTDAGGLGLNLQEAASVVVNLEVPWNPAVLEQRIGRVHRLGQRQGVRVLHFVTRDSIEERVRAVVESKKALFDGLLVDEVDRVELDEASQAGFFERIRTLVS